MSYFVLRKVHARGKSARASEATAVALAEAAVKGEMEYGPYLEWSDPDARNGFGDDRWTGQLRRAKRFSSFGAALECWKAQSRKRPLRDDGEPNRPMTAFSVSPVEIKS
jgi:hypothetical protein